MRRPKVGDSSGTPSEREYWADLTVEDLADDPEPVTDDWAADYELELDRRDTMASERYPLADAEPELFRAYMHSFVWPRISGRKTDLMIAERKGHDRSWFTRNVAHRGHVRYRVERHLDPARQWYRTVWRKPNIRPSHSYWLALPHGSRTRNVIVDLDNHVSPLATFRKGFYSIHPIWRGTDVYPPDPPSLTLANLDVVVLEKARRLHGVVGPEARWCISSRSLGFHIIMPLDRLTPSLEASEHTRQVVNRAGLPSSTEVYPYGGHTHRLPFGLDFMTFDPDGQLVAGFAEQMRLYLDDTTAPCWDDLLESLLRYWRALYEEASWHIVGKKTWRNLHARIEATSKDIDRWRSGSTVAVDVETASKAPSSSPRSDPTWIVTASPDWTAYVDRIKSRKKHYWLALVQDLALKGLPCHDCIDRAARELGRFLIGVQGVEPCEAIDLVCQWAESKSNGFITRLQTGRANDLRGQIRRIVNHVVQEQDFGGRLSRIRAKLVAGQYRQPIDLPALMIATGDQVVGYTSDARGEEEERVILVDKKVPSEAVHAGWGRIREKMTPYQPKDIRRRQRWWEIVRSVVSYLQCHGGEAPVPKTVQANLGGSPPTVKAVLDNLVAGGVIAKGKRQYAKPITYRLRDLDV